MSLTFDGIKDIFNTCAHRIHLNQVRSIHTNSPKETITRLVRSWQQQVMLNYGLIIIPLEEERKITELVHPSGFPQGVLAKVTIYFSYTHP